MILGFYVPQHGEDDVLACGEDSVSCRCLCVHIFSKGKASFLLLQVFFMQKYFFRLFPCFPCFYSLSLSVFPFLLFVCILFFSYLCTFIIA